MVARVASSVRSRFASIFGVRQQQNHLEQLLGESWVSKQMDNCVARLKDLEVGPCHVFEPPIS